MSLLSRAAVENVFPRVREMLELGGIYARRPEFIPYTQIQSAPLIAQYLGIDTDVVTALMHPVVVRDRLAEGVEWYGTPLPRRFVTTTRRFSPASMRNNQYGRAVWQIRPLTFCPESFELLGDKCFNCHHEVGWRMGCGFHACATCGRSILRSQPGKIEWELRKDAAAVAALVSASSETRVKALSVLPEPFRYWEPGDVFVAAVELGLAVSFPDRAQHAKISKSIGVGNFSDFTANHLVEGYRVISGWPTSFHTKLPNLIDETPGGLSRTLGPLSKFFHSGTAARPINRLIREEVKTVLPKLDLLALGYSGVRPDWVKRDDRVSAKEVMAQFGLDFKTVRRLDKSGLAVTRIGTKKERVFYNPELLAPSVAIYRDSVNALECARLLGVPEYCVEAIRQKGLLKAVTDNDALLIANCPRYVRSALNALLDRIASLPSHDGEGRRLSECLERQFHPGTWADALEALLAGKLRIIGGRNRGSVCPTDLVVNENDFEQFLAVIPERAPPANVIVSCTTAGALLGIAGAIVGHAVRAGLLLGKFPKVAGEIRLTDLAEFSRQYLLGGEGDFRLGHSRAFSARMKAAGYKPVAVLRRHAIWRRSDAEAFLQAKNKRVVFDAANSVGTAAATVGMTA